MFIRCEMDTSICILLNAFLWGKPPIFINHHMLCFWGSDYTLLNRYSNLFFSWITMKILDCRYAIFIHMHLYIAIISAVRVRVYPVQWFSSNHLSLLSFYITLFLVHSLPYYNVLKVEVISADSINWYVTILHFHQWGKNLSWIFCCFALVANYIPELLFSCINIGAN